MVIPWHTHAPDLRRYDGEPPLARRAPERVELGSERPLDLPSF
ncbi:hypothetical protein [Sorangium sp. So ce388]